MNYRPDVSIADVSFPLRVNLGTLPGYEELGSVNRAYMVPL